MHSKVWLHLWYTQYITYHKSYQYLVYTKNTWNVIYQVSHIWCQVKFIPIRYIYDALCLITGTNTRFFERYSSRTLQFFRYLDRYTLFVLFVGVCFFVCIFFRNISVVSFCLECLWVINVEAHATHCLMASATIIFFLFVLFHLMLSCWYFFSRSLYLSRRRAYVVLVVTSSTAGYRIVCSPYSTRILVCVAVL